MSFKVPVVMLSAFVVFTSSCAGMYEVLVSPQQRHRQEKDAVDAAMKESREKKDCEFSVNTLNGAKNRDRVRTSVGNHVTPYGDEVKRWWLFCAEGAAEVLKSTEGLEVDRLTRAARLYELALSLPISNLGLEDKVVGTKGHEHASELSVKTVTDAHAAVTTQLSTAQKSLAHNEADTKLKLDVAARAEQKGWLLAASFAWNAAAPLEPSVKQQRAEALARLLPLMRAQSAVEVALAPAAADGISPQLLAAIAAHESLTGHDLKLVTNPAAAQVVVQLAQHKTKAEKQEESVPMQQTYVSGRKTVPNPAIERLKEDIARADKEAAYWRKSAASVKCTGAPPCKSRISAQNNEKRELEHGQRYRKDLAGQKPTVLREETSTHQYTAKKQVFTSSCGVSAVLVTGGKAGAPLEGNARVQRSAMSWAAVPQVGLAGRNDPVPSSADLDDGLRTEAARVLVELLHHAPSAAAGQYDDKLAAATDPLEKLQYALVRAARSKATPDADACRALALQLFATAP